MRWWCVLIVLAVFLCGFFAWRHEHALRVKVAKAITVEMVLADCLDRSKWKPGAPFIDAAECGRKWDRVAGTGNVYRKAVLENFGKPR